MRRTALVITALLLATSALTGCGDGNGTAATQGTAIPGTTGTPATTRAAGTTAPPETIDATTPPPETSPPETAPSQEVPSEMTLFTSAFDDGGTVPIEYTCDGANDVPRIRFDKVPSGTTTLALAVIDPDGGNWIHWIAWNIPPGSGGIAPDAPAGDLADGTRQGENDYAQVFKSGDRFPGGAPLRINGWDGPCPPGGVHRYVFTLYALNGTIDLPTGTPGSLVLAAIEEASDTGDLIGEVTIVGFYPANS